MLRPVVCAILLFGALAPLHGQTLIGRIIDDSTRLPVASAVIRLMNDRETDVSRDVSDSGGKFVLVASRQGRFRMHFQRVGYQPILTQPFQLRAGQTAQYQLLVHAVSPFALDTLTVEGRLVVPVKLADFNRRRVLGFGEFITWREFQVWYPRAVTDVIRRLTVFEVLPNSARSPGDHSVRFRASARRWCISMTSV